ncbi:MAG: SDR family oxidoreductase [Patescibacteria group bacterium]
MKVAVVTGSSRGLGRALVLALAQEGYTVVVHFHKSIGEASEVLRQVRTKSPDSIKVHANLTDEKQVEVMFGEILAKVGRVDLLVNNVGNFLLREFAKTTNRQFRNILESNIYSTLFASRAVLPQMRKRKSGQIVNIGAVGAERIILRKRVVPYYLAKSGVYILTKVMASEEAKNGIKINMISPGSMALDIFKASDFPMGRSAKYTDVISALKFLISDEAKYISGANIEVAGAFIPGF